MSTGRRDLAIALALLAAIVAVLVFAEGSASADVGVTGASRHAGRPGAEVRLRIDCGFCFPPCRRPKGHRHPQGFAKGPCMLGVDRPPPSSFGVSLLPLAQAERLVACEVEHHRRCPRPTRAPRRGHYAYLGEATPPPGGNDPEAGDLPRYLLSFAIPRLAAGDYAYVVWCGVCLGGRAGSLVTAPASPRWRLRVLP